MRLLPLLFLLFSGVLADSGTPSNPTRNSRKPILYVGYNLYQKALRSPSDLVPITLVVAALNANDGKKIWQSNIVDIPSGEGPFDTQITVDGTLLYVVFSPTFSTGQIVALEAKTGHILWRYTENAGRIFPTVAARGVFFMKVEPNTLQALDGQSGKRLWSVSTGEYVLDLIAVTGKAVALYQFKAVLGVPEPSYSGIVRVLRLSDGGEIWQKEVANLSGGADLPNLVQLQADDQAVYLLKWQRKLEHSSFEGGRTLVALSIQNGTLLWSDDQLQENPDSLGAWLVLSEHRLYLVGQYHMSFFNAQNGALLKAYTTPSNLVLTTTLASQSFVPQNYLYGNGPGMREQFCSLKSSDGTKLWCSDIYPDIGKIVVGNENIYLSGYRAGDQQRAIYVLRQLDGRQVGRYSMGDPTLVNPYALSMAFAEELF